MTGFGGWARSLAFLTVVAGAGAAQAAGEAGTLTCEVAPGVGLIVGSQKAVACAFRSTTGAVEVYDGEITKLGVDIGVTDRFVIVWTVLAATSGTQYGALAGTYVGATAEATVGGGVGANVLVGGFNRTITLQPVSVSAQTGLDVAAGAAELTLRLRPPPPGPRR